MNRGSSTTVSTKLKATFKVVLVGQRGVGKTSLLMRYDRGVFCKAYAVTIGVQSITKETMVEGEKVALQLWDSTGQYGFKSLVKSFYSQACCVVIVYSDPQELKNTVDFYRHQINEFAAHNTFVAAVRAKTDLLPMSCGEQEILDSYQKERSIDYWMDVSSKEGTNVEHFFERLSALLLQQFEEDYQFRTLVAPKKKDSIYLSKSGVEHLGDQRKGNCCKG